LPLIKDKKNSFGASTKVLSDVIPSQKFIRLLQVRLEMGAQLAKGLFVGQEKGGYG
jgi:hypothetical protein